MISRLKSNMPQIIKDNTDRLIAALVFAAVFAFMGWIIPDMYYRYIDPTTYYKLNVPFTVDKKDYKAGEVLYATTIRTSLVESPAEVIVELVKVTNGNTVTPRFLYKHKFAMVPVVDQPVMYKIDIPTDTDCGVYFIKGIVTYEVHGYKKNFSFYSESFTIQ